MKAYYVAKSKRQLERIKKTSEISLGQNVSSDELFAHISLTPFRKGSFALDVIGDDTGKAWILELEIPDNTELEDDPSGEGPRYGGEWKVSRTPIRIERIVSEEYVPDVLLWELGEENLRKIFGPESEAEPRRQAKKRAKPGERLK